MTDRYQAFRDLARRDALDAIALVPGANFHRLFGKAFHSHERPLVVVIPMEGPPSAIVPNLELSSFSAIDFEGDVFDWRDQDGYQAAFDALFQKASYDRIGVEGQVMRVFVHHAIQQASSGSVLLDSQRAIASLRLCKTDREIDALTEAIRRSEKALSETLETVQVGQSEKAIESRLIQRLFAAGCDEFSFSPIVAAGTNSAQPHAHARENYAIQPGDALLIDFGGRFGGMCADITRTFFVQHCTDERAELYETVRLANEHGHDATRPGATAHDVDDAVTKVLESSKFADRIRHKTGHGLGRDVHEDPYIMRGNREELTAGMVFTIEPGLYHEADCGIRIEDDVLVTEDGVRSLTVFDKSLTLVG